jgi:hypothetical protein
VNRNGTPTKRKKRRRSLVKGRLVQNGRDRKKIRDGRSKIENFLLGSILVHKTIGVTDSLKFESKGKNFQGKNLQGKNLQGKNFQGKNLQRKNLQRKSGKSGKKRNSQKMYNREFHTFNLGIRTSEMSGSSDSEESNFRNIRHPKSVKSTLAYSKGFQSFNKNNPKRENSRENENLTLNSNFLNRMKKRNMMKKSKSKSGSITKQGEVKSVKGKMSVQKAFENMSNNFLNLSVSASGSKMDPEGKKKVKERIAAKRKSKNRRKPK